ncbi:hypothetical protein E4U28_001663 [Claviceps purpurea]|nr:hypothetical protein E4U28_001663 [Claviceps purpurea]
MDSTTSLSNDKLAHLLYTAINVLTAVTPVIAAITTIAIITAIIMEFVGIAHYIVCATVSWRQTPTRNERS